MTSNNVLINDTVRVTVKFVNIDTVTGDPVEISPTSVSVTVKDGSNSVVTTASATQLSSSVWYYDFIPTEADTYSVEFLGVVPSTGNILVQQKIYVSSLTEDYKPTVILGADETITFAGAILPLYLDPELLVSFFPDASLLEIAEIIHSYSLEVKSLFKLNDDEDGSNLAFIVLEYIKAATACELTRTYGLGGDDEVSLRLGDLTITNRNLPRNAITRDNATTWCQVAAALRKEMLANKAGPLAMQIKNLPSFTKFNDFEKTAYPGDREIYSYRRKTAYDDPMPGRGLRSYD
jgi:hypothetical protein